MKTIEEWFNTLPNGLKDTALKQMLNNMSSKETNCIGSAIFFGLYWEETIEGDEFWRQMYLSI